MKIQDLIYQLRYLYFKYGNIPVLLQDHDLNVTEIAAIGSGNITLDGKLQRILCFQDNVTSFKARSLSDQVNLKKEPLVDSNTINIFTRKPIKDV